MEARTGRKEWWIAALVVVVFGALLGSRLLVQPIVGIADNGDFDRLLCPNDLAHPDDRTRPDRYFNWINGTYDFGERPACRSVFSSASLAVQAALALNSASGGGASTFDLRFLGLVNAVVMVVGILLIALSTRDRRLSTRAWLLFFSWVVLADVGYAVFLNSFYGEAATLVFFVTTAGLFLWVVKLFRGPKVRSPARLALILLLAASNLLFVTSKPQNVVMAAASLVLGWYLVQRGRFRLERAVVIVGVIALPFGSFLLLGQLNPYFVRANRFAAVFQDTLQHSPTPREDLRELGLPEEYERYVGTTPYTKGAPIGDPEFAERFDRIGYGTLAKFYLHHPERALGDLRRSASLTFDLRREGTLGHFEKRSGRPARAQSAVLSVWSEFRERVFPREAWFLAVFGLLSLAILAVKHRRYDEDDFERGVTSLHLWALATGGIAYVSVALTEGSFDPKHMFLFNLAFDTCCVLTLMHVTGLLISRRGLGHGRAGKR